MGDAAEFSISGFHVVTALWLWTLAVLLHGLWRSFWSSAPDAVRPSGPAW